MTLLTSPTALAGPPATPPARTTVTLWFFRGTALVQAAGMVLMPFLIGSFLQGNYPALAVHAAVGGVLLMLTTIELAAAVTLRWPGGLPLWPALATLALVVLTTAQLGLGYARVVAWHLPLGVLLVSSSVLLAAWAWWPGRARRSALPPRDRAGARTEAPV